MLLMHFIEHEKILYKLGLISQIGKIISLQKGTRVI